MSSSGLPKRSGVRIWGSQVQPVVVLVHVDIGTEFSYEDI